jgi:hypothetical protein
MEAVVGPVIPELSVLPRDDGTWVPRELAVRSPTRVREATGADEHLAMSVVIWLLVGLVAWSLVACFVGILVGGAARLRDLHPGPSGSGLSRSAVRRAA